eukprot:g1773.t1
MNVLSKPKRWVVLPSVAVVLWKALKRRNRHLRHRTHRLAARNVVPELVEQNLTDLATAIAPVNNTLNSQLPPFDWERLPELALAKIFMYLKEDADGNIWLSHLRSTCRALRNGINSNLRSLQGNRILAAGAGLNDLSRFQNISSLRLNLHNHDLDDFVTILHRMHFINELCLEHVSHSTALCECLSHKNSLNKLDFRNSILPNLSFISNLTNLTSLVFIDIKVENSKSDLWKCMRSLEELSIDKSDEIAMVNMTSFCAIPNLNSLYLGLGDYERSELLTLSDLRATLLLCLYQIKDPTKLSALQSLPTLKSLSLISCDLRNFPFPLASLENLEHLRILTNALYHNDVENLVGVKEKLKSLQLELMSTNMPLVKDLCRSGLPLKALKVNTDIFEPEDSLNNCLDLTDLYISATREVGSGIFKSLGQLAFLEHLTLRECLFSIDGLENLSISCPVLRSLTIGACVLSNVDCEHIARVTSLQRLELLCCISLSTISPLNDLQKLKTLKIENCMGIEENLTAVLNENILTKLESLEFLFSPNFEFERYDNLFAELRCKSPCMILTISRQSR